MGAATFMPGVPQVRPGVYVDVINSGAPVAANLGNGTVACLFQADWGPIATMTQLLAVADVASKFGSTADVDAPAQALLGGCQKVLAYRLDGTGKAAASATLVDTTTPTAVNAVTIAAKYEGTRGNGFNVTIKDDVSDATLRDCNIYEGTTLLQSVTFAKGSSGVGEPAALVAALADSPWVTATKIADGNKALAAVTNVSLTGGVSPTVAAQNYSDGLTAFATQLFDVLCLDSADQSIAATVQAWIDGVRNQGMRVIAVIGEPTSVLWATRLSDVAVFNDAAIVYVGNGFVDTSGVTHEGWAAACRVAGMISAAPLTASLTHALVSGASSIQGSLSSAYIAAAIQAGMFAFSLNTAGKVQCEYGINTLVTPATNQDAGWKKIRRVRTRDYLLGQIAAVWDPLIGTVNNDANGQATLIGKAQAVIDGMIRDGELASGKIALDPGNPPSGDACYFLATVQDLDSAEHIYITMGFQY